MWNLWTPNTIARSFLSMHAYRFSASVRDFDAYAIVFFLGGGCISAVPSPFRLASFCNTGISVVLKYVNVESGRITVLSFSKHSLCCSSYKKGVSFFNSPRRVCVLWARLGINGDRYVIRPKNSCSSFLHVGYSMFCRSLIFSGSGLTPFSLYIIPKKDMLFDLILHFSELNTRPFSAAICMSLCKILSCSSSDLT